VVGERECCREMMGSALFGGAVPRWLNSMMAFCFFGGTEVHGCRCRDAIS
jgi:hypothetical protein